MDGSTACTRSATAVDESGRRHDGGVDGRIARQRQQLPAQGDALARGAAQQVQGAVARLRVLRVLDELGAAGDRGEDVVEFVRDAVGQPAGDLQLLRLDQAIGEALAFDGVAHGALHHVGVELSLDQPVLGAELQGLPRDLDVGDAGEHDDRHLRRRRENRAQRGQAFAVGKIQVEHHRVGAGPADLLERTLRSPTACTAAGSVPAANASPRKEANAASSSTSSTRRRGPLGMPVRFSLPLGIVGPAAAGLIDGRACKGQSSAQR